MRLTDILKPECVKVPLVSDGKREAIFELAELLCANTEIQAVEELKEAIWEREQTRTTGIGHGIAIPHGKTGGCPELSMAIGKPSAPIEFGAIDGKPVQLIILLASPVDQTGPHIQALARISQMLTQETVRQGIMTAPDAAAVYRVIEENEPATA